MTEEFTDHFPLSETKRVKGTRRLAREKVLQILTAYHISGISPDKNFHHIFFRKFNFSDTVSKKSDKLLTPYEIKELEADVPIDWKEDEIEFGKALTWKVIENMKYYDQIIEDFAKNWELERIALIDRILMHMAFAELTNFPEIPPKVSVNEAIDIAKKYSTDKSNTFINGILDAAMEKFRKDGKMNKSGRGLKNS